MDEAIVRLNDHLRIILPYINERIHTIQLDDETKVYVHKILRFRDRFRQYHEETTPRTLLSSMYNCMGRLKFFADQMLYIYLEISERTPREPNNHRPAVLWPVMFKWKLEIVDEDSGKTVSLGEASCVFNRPRQGFVSHPNDWISIDLDTIVSSGCIAPDGSATLKWTVVTKPILQIENVAEFHEILETLKTFCDNYEGPEEQISYILRKVLENGDRMTRMENILSDMDSKLVIIETRQDDFRQKFEEFRKDAAPVFQFVRSELQNRRAPREQDRLFFV